MTNSDYLLLAAKSRADFDSHARRTEREHEKRQREHNDGLEPQERHMQSSNDDDRPRLLDPVDRISEILFGLIMAVTIVGSLSIASAGKNEVRTVLYAALGCNIAWGLVDAVMYLVRTMTERTRYFALGRKVLDADPATARRVIASTLPDHLAKIAGP